MRIRTFVVGLVLAAVATGAHAQPVLFAIDGPGSSIGYTTQSGGCGDLFNPEPCISVAAVGGLGATVFNLERVGDSQTFDFAEVAFGNSVGGETGDFEVTIAFDSPTGARASTAFGIELAELNGINLGGSVTVGATVTLLALAAAVPEPTSLALIGLGLLALAAIRYRFRRD